MVVDPVGVLKVDVKGVCVGQFVTLRIVKDKEVVDVGNGVGIVLVVLIKV